MIARVLLNIFALPFVGIACFLIVTNFQENYHFWWFWLAVVNVFVVGFRSVFNLLMWTAFNS